jgi:hypothetical protein
LWSLNFPFKELNHLKVITCCWNWFSFSARAIVISFCNLSLTVETIQERERE